MSKSKIIETLADNNENEAVEKVEKENKQVKPKKSKKNKEKGKLKRKAQETISELKKVTWPSFGTIVKKTGIVLGFVSVSLVVLLLIDLLLKFLTGLFY